MRKSSPVDSALEKKLLALLTMSLRLSFIEPDSSMTQMMSALGSAAMVLASQASSVPAPALARAVPPERSSTTKPVGRLGSW